MRDSTVNENIFHGVDLNLLIIFVVLMREGSATRAAETLKRQQPGISVALKKLRVLFDDALFVRAAHGLKPTPRAQEIVRIIAPAVELLANRLGSALAIRETPLD